MLEVVWTEYEANVEIRNTATVVLVTAGPLGERPPALVSHFFITYCTNYCLFRFNVPVSGGHLSPGATFAPNRRWPLVADTTVTLEESLRPEPRKYGNILQGV